MIKEKEKPFIFITDIGEIDISCQFGYLKTFNQDRFRMTISLKWSIDSKSFDLMAEEQSLQLLKYITATLLHFGNYFWDYFKPFFIVKLSEDGICLDNVNNYYTGDYLKIIYIKI